MDSDSNAVSLRIPSRAIFLSHTSWGLYDWTYVLYTQTLPEQLSFMHIPKPFKNPAYTKNATRRTQTLKTLLSREKERDKAVRAARNKTKNEVEGGGEVKMEVEGAAENVANTMDGEDRMDIDATGEKRPVIQLQLDEDELAEGIDPDDIPSCTFESIGFT